MRFILPLFILTLAHSSCDHSIAFKKRVIGPEETLLPASPENRNKFIKSLVAGPNPESTLSHLGAIHVAKDEIFVYSTQTSVYKIRTIPDSTRATLIKTTGDVEDARVEEWSIDGATEVLDDEGYLMYEDCMDGDCAMQIFYSPSLEELNRYMPYPTGTMFSNVSYSDKLVCVYTQLQGDSLPFKVSLLNHKGDLLIEKEFSDEGHHGFGRVQLAENKIFLVLDDLTSPRAKVIALDTKLNLLWRKK